ncbi:Uncharacterised protein [uncultured archaeon]|nr:Uncharacterised protein [uncultured archaeon]
MFKVSNINQLKVGRFSNDFELLARSKKPVSGSQCFAFFALPTLKLNNFRRVW